MSDPKVSIRFCGGCNPRIDRGLISLELKKALDGMGLKTEFNSPQADFVIYLSGCFSSCALKFHPADVPYTSVASNTVDLEEVGVAGIVPEVIRKVKEYYEGRETEILKKNNDCS